MNSSSPPSNSAPNHDPLLEEILRVCVAATKGDLELRIHGRTADPYLNKIGLAINSLLDSTDVYVRESTASLRAASEGRYYRRVLERGMQGTFRAGAKRLNASVHDMEIQSIRLQQAEAGRAEMLSHLERTLVGSAQRIADAIRAISEITLNAKILALNAQVQATRAGEAGRGFSVVAHEMGMTSQQVNQVMSEVDRVFAEFKVEIERQADLLKRSSSQAA